MISERISILLREQELLEKNRKRFMDQQLNKEDTDISHNSSDMDGHKNSNDSKPIEEFKKETAIIKEVEENEEEIFL